MTTAGTPAHTEPKGQLGHDELVLLGDYVENEFLRPLLSWRAQTPAEWGKLSPRLSLSAAGQQILGDARDLDRDSTVSWRALARRRRTDVSTLTRRYRRAQTWLATARFLLFMNPDRWSVRELLLSEGDASVRGRLMAEADVQCDVFDQTYRAGFAPYPPVPFRQDDPRRLGDHDKSLLAAGAHSLAGPRALYLDVQGATGRRSTIDLTPRLDATKIEAARLATEEGALAEAVRRFDELAAQRLEQHRRSGRRTS